MSTSTFRPFALGRNAVTPAAQATFSIDTLLACLLRHSRGDWGNLDEHDDRANTEGTHTGDRLLSSYELPEGTLWIVTEADRSVTTMLLPSDY